MILDEIQVYKSHKNNKRRDGNSSSSSLTNPFWSGPRGGHIRGEKNLEEERRLCLCLCLCLCWALDPFFSSIFSLFISLLRCIFKWPSRFAALFSRVRVILIDIPTMLYSAHPNISKLRSLICGLQVCVRGYNTQPKAKEAKSTPISFFYIFRSLRSFFLFLSLWCSVKCTQEYSFFLFLPFFFYICAPAVHPERSMKF